MHGAAAAPVAALTVRAAERCSDLGRAHGVFVGAVASDAAERRSHQGRRISFGSMVCRFVGPSPIKQPF
jgi:hypothetical protein